MPRNHTILATAMLLSASLMLHAEPSTAAAAEKSCPLPNPVTQSMTLDPSCQYQGPLVVAASGITVDCSNALINAFSAKHGILVKGEKLHDVTIKNCKIDGAQAQGVLLSQPTTDADMAARPVTERFALGLNNIRLDNITVTNSGSVGIFVDSYTQNTVISNSKVLRSGGAGVYLEHSSRKATLRNNVIAGNGFGDTFGRRKSGRREGLAVDSSAYNIIEGNTFSANAAGGVFFYKNCWEHHTRPGTVRRWQHSSHNQVKGNLFDNEKIGVWIASRQSRDLSNWDCGDQPLAPGYYRDYAEDNSVIGNRFVSNKVGVRVNDNNATVADNLFVGAERGCVELGSITRDKLIGRPVEGALLANNACDLAPVSAAPKGNPFPADRGFREIGASEFAACKGNKLNTAAFRCNR